LFLAALSTAPATAAIDAVRVRIGNRADPVERNVAKLLTDRIGEAGAVRPSVEVERDATPTAKRKSELVILLGIPAHHDQLSAQFERLRIARLTELAPGPEGFLLRTVPDGDGLLLLAAGIDPRGVLYAAGEILRRIQIGERQVMFPSKLEVRTAPAFEVRGTQFGQSGVARRRAGVRPWTEAETHRAILDDALAGANTFNVGAGTGKDAPIYRFMKSFDLKTLVQYCPNVGSGPAEWQGKESIGRKNYLCPSVPGARKHLLERAENTFKRSVPFDYVRFNAGDGGGCECDRCKPYGGVFIRLCEDLAAIIHRYHPDTEIFAANQKLDDASDLAIFKYLQEKPRPWLRAFCYGPGSDAMTWQPGHRQTHRMDLLRYPGFGPFDRYLKEILHQLPPQQDIVFYNEITHWRYSQNGYIQMYPRPDLNGDLPPHWGHFIYDRRPDQFLTMVYDRLTFYAWPRYYHRVFGETVRYGIGDVTHSSGHHDHFNQWMWQRLLWAPHTSVEDVVNEYARTWFGPEAAPLMADAIFQLEENIEENPDDPLPQKEGIDRYYELVKQAGTHIPAPQRKTNWLWRMYMQKAAIDKYVQLKVRQQLALQARVETHVTRALEDGKLDAAINTALPWLGDQAETPEMERLRVEAGRLGNESNALFGVRSEGYFSLDHDFIGLGWLERQLERARAASPPEKAELLTMIVAYEDPGPGGFYDNCGTGAVAPHLINGSPYDHGQPYLQEMLSEANRPCQRSMAFTQHESPGVMFRYRDLDPSAQYRVRFTLVRPWYQERYALRMNQKSESIYADDVPLAENLEPPERMSDFFTFDVPPETTRDGELVLRFEKAPDVASGSRVDVEIWHNCGGWGTVVSEVWLMKQN